DLFPILLRCRHLTDSAGQPITSLIRDLGERAELGSRIQEFVELVNGPLRKGNVLLLVDGLDEIADGAARSGFVGQLRSFLAIYPNVDVVLTSREAGFRHVAVGIVEQCRPYRIAEFDDA